MQVNNNDISFTDFKTSDSGIFKKLFEHFYPRVCTFAYSLINDEQAAEDIVQDVFVKMWNKDLSCPTVLTFKIYLYNSVQNACYNFTSRKKNTTEIDEFLFVSQEDVERKLIATEIEAMILEKIESLPEGRKKVMKMSLSGCSIEDIAISLDVSVNTVKTQKRKAKDWLRDELGDLYIFVL